MGRRVQRRRAPRRVLGLAHPAEGVALGVAGVLVAATLYSAVTASTGGTVPAPSTATPTSSVSTLDSEDVAGYPSRLLLSQPSPERPAGSGVRAVPGPGEAEEGADPTEPAPEPSATSSAPTATPSASTSEGAEPAPEPTPSGEPGGSGTTENTSTTAPKTEPEPSPTPDGAGDGPSGAATDSADAAGADAAHPPVADSAAAQGPVGETSADEALASTTSPEAPAPS